MPVMKQTKTTRGTLSQVLRYLKRYTPALLLSLLFFHRLQGLGIGTIFSALAVGRFVDLYNRRLPLISRISALGART